MWSHTVYRLLNKKEYLAQLVIKHHDLSIHAFVSAPSRFSFLPPSFLPLSSFLAKNHNNNCLTFILEFSWQADTRSCCEPPWVRSTVSVHFGEMILRRLPRCCFFMWGPIAFLIWFAWFFSSKIRIRIIRCCSETGARWWGRLWKSPLNLEPLRGLSKQMKERNDGNALSCMKQRLKMRFEKCLHLFVNLELSIWFWMFCCQNVPLDVSSTVELFSSRKSQNSRSHDTFVSDRSTNQPKHLIYMYVNGWCQASEQSIDWLIDWLIDGTENSTSRIRRCRIWSSKCNRCKSISWPLMFFGDYFLQFQRYI